VIKGIWVGPGTLKYDDVVYCAGDEIDLPENVVRSVGDSFAPSLEEKPKAPAKKTKKSAKKK